MFPGSVEGSGQGEMELQMFNLQGRNQDLTNLVLSFQSLLIETEVGQCRNLRIYLCFCGEHGDHMNNSQYPFLCTLCLYF